MFIQYYKKKFLFLKKEANSQMILVLSVLNSLSGLYLLSWKASLLIWIYSDQFTLQSWQIEVLVHIPTIFFVALAMTSLYYVTRGMLWITHISQKATYLGLLRFEAMYWKRYRKSSPLTEQIWKFQTRYTNMSTQQKIRIFFVSSVVITIYMMYRAGYFAEKLPQGII